MGPILAMDITFKHTYVIFTLLIIAFYVHHVISSMSNLCQIHVKSMSNPCHFHVISMSHPFWDTFFTILTFDSPQRVNYESSLKIIIIKLDCEAVLSCLISIINIVHIKQSYIFNKFKRYVFKNANHIRFIFGSPGLRSDPWKLFRVQLLQIIISIFLGMIEEFGDSILLINLSWSQNYSWWVWNLIQSHVFFLKSIQNLGRYLRLSWIYINYLFINKLDTINLEEKFPLSNQDKSFFGRHSILLLEDC